MRTLIVALNLTVIMAMLPVDGYAGEHQFLNTGISRARALALGGAYHSVEDDLSAAFYNPGALKINAPKRERPFRIFLNPLAPGAMLYDYSRYDLDYLQDDTLTGEEMLLAASMFLKGAVFTTPVLDMGIGLGEELPVAGTPRTLGAQYVTAEGLTAQAMHAVFMNVKIAPTVSVGISGTMFTARRDGEFTVGTGYIFGVLLAPDPRLNLGIAYHTLPRDFTGARMELEGIEHEGASGGISYYPNDDTVISIDLRNLNNEDEATSREIHAGIERRFMDRIAIRAGYFRKKETKHDYMSFGVGIVPLWERTSRQSNASRSDILSYTIIMEENDFSRYWHALSFSIRL